VPSLPEWEPADVVFGALAVAVDTGLGGPGAYDHLPPRRRPQLHLPGVDELLGLCRGASE
jgi:hypothetical protein